MSCTCCRGRDHEGKTARLAYYVSLRVGQHENLQVFLEDFQFQEIENHPVSPEMLEQLKPVIDVTSTLPGLDVSSSGRYLGFEGVDAMVERVARFRQMPPERIALVRRVFSSPQMAATIQASIDMYWATWVESWLGWNLAPGTETTTEDLQLFGTQKAPATLRREFLGLRDGYATLRQTSTVTGEAARSAVANLVKSVAEQVGNAAAQQNMLKDARLQVTLYAETLPVNLRPRHTVFDKAYEFVLTDGTQVSEREHRDVSWHWERAVGCTRPRSTG